MVGGRPIYFSGCGIGRTAQHNCFYLNTVSRREGGERNGGREEALWEWMDEGINEGMVLGMDG